MLINALRFSIAERSDQSLYDAMDGFSLFFFQKPLRSRRGILDEIGNRVFSHSCLSLLPLCSFGLKQGVQSLQGLFQRSLGDVRASSSLFGKIFLTLIEINAFQPLP